MAAKKATKKTAMVRDDDPPIFACKDYPGYPNLVQRLTAHNPMVLKYRLEDTSKAPSIGTYFAFDYMGSAEFEFGAIPEAKRSLIVALEDARWPDSTPITVGNHTAWYVGPVSGLSRATYWFKTELDHSYTGMKERSGLRSSYLNPTDRYQYDGWFCLDTPEFGLFRTKKLANDFVRGIRGQRRAP